MNPKIIQQLLSIKKPERGDSIAAWRQYNELQYSVLLLKEATEADKKLAKENLVVANYPLFLKRAKKEKRFVYGLEFDDIVNIEIENFLSRIAEAVDAGITEFPSATIFDPFSSKKEINEAYSPCGVKMSYATKKRQVADNKYNVQRISFVEEKSDPFVAASESYSMTDRDLFEHVWQEDLKDSLGLVLRELSQYEINMLTFIAAGYSNIKIAKQFGVTEATIRRNKPKVLAHIREVAIRYGLDAYLSDV